MEINNHSPNQSILTKTTIAKYEYDDFGHRVMKETPKERLFYLNTGLSVLNEITETGQMYKLMIPGTTGALAELSFDNTVRFIHSDIQGTTRAITDQKAQVIATYEYDPFGELTNMQEIGQNDPLKNKGTNYLYTNQEYDEESSLIYYNARYYNPATSRFISRDTYLGELGNTISRNRYAYVLNNPYKYTDPTGHEPASILATVETGLDVTFLLYDGGTYLYHDYQANNSLTEEQKNSTFCSIHEQEAYIQYGNHIEKRDEAAVNVGLDVVGISAPFVSNIALKGGNKIIKYGDEAVDTTKNIDKASDTKKADQLTDNRNKGIQGEIDAGIPDTPKQPIKVDGQKRIPDYLDQNILLEIKNVNYLSNTQQLRDFAKYANDNNLEFIIEVADRTKLSKTLIKLQDEGQLTIRRIGDTLNNKTATSNIVGGALILNIGQDGASYLDNK